MIKIITVLLTLLLTSLVSGIPSAYAHVLKSDKTIGAVLHIDPDDDPIVGETATFYLEIKDKENKFNATQCECTVIIKKNDEILLKQGLFDSSGASNLTSPSFSFIFPEKAVYSISIQGKPFSPQTFESFNLDYELRVERQNQTTTPSTTERSNSSWLPYIIISSIILIFFAIVFSGKLKKMVTCISLLTLISTLLLHNIPQHHTHDEHRVIAFDTSHITHPCCIPQTPTSICIAPIPKLPTYRIAHYIYHDLEYIDPFIHPINNKAPPIV